MRSPSPVAHALRTTALAALLATGAPLAGCGSSQRGAGGPVYSAGAAGPITTAAIHAPRGRRSTRSATALSGLTPASTRGKISVAAAADFAHAVNLTAADVPGARAVPRVAHSEDPSQGQDFARCLGVAPAHEIVDVKSPRLNRGAGIEEESFTSAVSVDSTPREAARELLALQRRRAWSCLERRLRKQVGKSFGHAALGTLRLSSPHLVLPGVAASAELRVEVTLLSSRRTSIPLYIDEFAFALGAAEVRLGTFSVVQPVAPATERELLSVLMLRAKTHAL